MPGLHRGGCVEGKGLAGTRLNPAWAPAEEVAVLLAPGVAMALSVGLSIPTTGLSVPSPLLSSRGCLLFPCPVHGEEAGRRWFAGCAHGLHAPLAPDLIH